MVFVTEITNPFDPANNRKTTMYESGKRLEEYLPDSQELIVSLDGVIVDNYSTELSGTHQIIVSPVIKGDGGGKDVLRAIAMIAIAVYAPQLAATLNVFGGSVSYYAIQAGIVLGGGMLVNAVLPPQVPPTGTGSTLDTSPTYGWSASQTVPTPGAPIPVLYGQMKVSGSVIGQYIQDEGDNEYLYVLLALCEGEIEPISIDDIEINGNPASNYDDVEYAYRVGTMDQILPVDSFILKREVFHTTPNIPWFDRVSTANPFSIEVAKDSPQTRDTLGNSVEELVVSVSCPSGLYYVNDSGGLDERTVRFTIEYSSDNSTTWTLFRNTTQDFAPVEWEWKAYSTDGWEYIYVWSADKPTGIPNVNDSAWYKTGRSRQLVASETGYDYFEIIAAQSTSVRRQVNIYDLPANSYTVRVTKLTDDVSDTRENNTFYWNGMTEVVNDKLYYPGIALLALRMKASSTLSGSSLSVRTLVRRKDFDVYDESGALVGTKRSDNPAWAMWDALTNKKHGYRREFSKVEYSAFASFADWCDQAITDGNGYPVPRATFNGIIDFQSNVWEILQTIASVGRGSPMIKGTKYSVLVDKPESPTQLFTMGNIKKSSFSVAYTPKTDIATEIDIEYIDRDADYNQNVITVSSQPGMKTTMQSIGTDNQSQAFTLGRYLIRCGEKQRRVVSFEAGVDSIASNIGDVIMFAHDVPAWGYSGRIVSATTNTVTLDQKIDVDATKNYQIVVRLQDDTIDIRNIVNVVTGQTDTFTVGSDFTSIPQLHDVFSFGESAYLKLRIIDMTRKNDLTRKIKAIDYNESILTDYDVPTAIDRPSYIKGFAEITDIVAGEHLEKRKDGTIIPFIDFSWRVKDGRSAVVDLVIYSSDSKMWNEVQTGITGTSYRMNAIELEEGRSYTFAFVVNDPTGKQGIDDAAKISHTYFGKLAPPENVTNFSYSITTNGILLSWDANTDLDLSGYNLYFDGVQIEENLKATTYLYSDVTLGLHELGIKAVDTSGNESEVLTTTTLDMQGPTITSLKSEVIDNSVLLVWESQKGTVDISEYIIKKDGVEIGTNDGKIISIFESQAGEYTYTVIPVDIFGNQNDGKSVTTRVDSPPDYKLNANWNSDFTGTKVNAYSESGRLLLPVNTTETWEEHFTNNNWASPQDQIDAGYPIYIEPFLGTASYEETFDYGAALAGTKVSVATTLTNVQGSVTETCTISLSLDGSNWTDYVDTYQVYGTNFRYVKIRLDYSGTNSAVYIEKLNVKLDSKLKNDSGTTPCLASDVNGTEVFFNESFVDIESIVLTPKGTTSITAVYDFADVPNPTSFKIYLFDLNGNRVDGDCGWQVKGY